MNISWDIFSSKANLIHIMEYLNFTMVEQSDSYRVYQFGKKYFTVINQNGNYVFFNPSDPNYVGGCIDLLLLYVSSLETEKKLTDWQKVQLTIEKYLEKQGGLEKISEIDYPDLKAIDKDFNLFTYKYLKTSYLESQNLTSDNDVFELIVSNDLENHPLFKNKIISHNNLMLFPLINQTNKIVGLLANTKNSIQVLPYSDTKSSIWHSNIPKKLDTVFVFDSPKEAIFFYLNFRIDNALYISCQNINFTITDLLLNIQKVAKAKKLVLSFTSSAKGYVQDLRLFSQLKEMGLILETKERFLEMTFPYDNEETLQQLYSTFQKYNNEVSIKYRDFTSIPNQEHIKQKLITMVKDPNSEKTIKIRIPTSLNTLKLFVWGYHKYLVKSKFSGQTEILKPEKSNWYSQYHHNLELHNKNQETKMYKLAM